MELSDRLRPEPFPGTSETEISSSEVSSVWTGVPEPTWGCCACRQPDCRGVHVTADRADDRQTQQWSTGRPGPSLWSRSQLETTDLWHLVTRWQDRWPPDRDRRHSRHVHAHPATTATQATATTRSRTLQVSFYHSVQVDHASIHGCHGAARGASSTLPWHWWQEIRLPT